MQTTAALKREFQFLELQEGSPDEYEYLCLETAWEVMQLKRWPATPQLLFALKELTKELNPHHAG